MQVDAIGHCDLNASSPLKIRKELIELWFTFQLGHYSQNRPYLGHFKDYTGVIGSPHPRNSKFTRNLAKVLQTANILRIFLYKQ